MRNSVDFFGMCAASHFHFLPRGMCAHFCRHTRIANERIYELFSAPRDRSIAEVKKMLLDTRTENEWKHKVSRGKTAAANTQCEHSTVAKAVKSLG